MTLAQKLLTYAGIVFTLYILFRYIVPFILGLLGIVFTFLLKLVLFFGVIVAIIVGLSFVVRAVRK
jgi:hypothetical protein